MYWKPEYSSDFSALFLTAENAAEEMYLLNDSTCGDIHLAVPSVCTSMQNHFFYIPAAPVELGRMISVYVENFSHYVLNNALPGVYELTVTVSASVCKTLSRAFSFCLRKIAVSRKKRYFTSFRPCVLRL